MALQRELNTMHDGKIFIQLCLENMVHNTPQTIDKNIETLKMLIDEGSDVFYPDTQGVNTIIYIIALWGRHNPITAYLLGGIIDVIGYRSHLQDLITNNDDIIIQLIDFEGIDEKSATLILEAIDRMCNPNIIDHKRVLCLEKIIKKGFDLNTELNINNKKMTIVEFIKSLWKEKPDIISHFLN